MDAITNTMGSGARGIGFTAMGTEFLYMLQQERFAVILICLLIICDFRLGWGESSARYEEAKQTGDTYSINKYKWRTSRAMRRSMNKFLDYMLICLVGLYLGAAILEQWGIARMWGTHAAVVGVMICEGRSILGHIVYLHARWINPDTAKSGLWKFISRFAILFVKKKNEDMGNVLEEALQECKAKEKDGTATTKKRNNTSEEAPAGAALM